jgi:hypothetical protein
MSSAPPRGGGRIIHTPPPESRPHATPAPEGRPRTTPPPEGRPRTTPPPFEAPPAAALLELERNLYAVVRYDPVHRLAIITRSEEQYRSIEDLRWSFDRMRRAFELLSTGRASLLIDSRKAPPRNDPEFERVMAPLRQDVFRNFAKAVVLVQTAVGVLQVTRHAKLDGQEMGVFTSLGEALAYLGLPLDEQIVAAVNLGG